jgi:hypothetical protein
MSDALQQRPAHVYLLATIALSLFIVHATRVLDAVTAHPHHPVVADIQIPAPPILHPLDLVEIRAEAERIRAGAESLRIEVEGRHAATLKAQRALTIEAERLARVEAPKVRVLIQ